MIENDCEIASWHSAEAVSRAEDLLFSIADLFERTKIEKHSVDLIAVSNGPGSYTGIRIGLATAQGLANSLNIECVGVSLLRAVAAMYRKRSKCVVAIPIGRTELCWQTFEPAGDMRSVESARTGSVDDFIEHSVNLLDFDLLLQHDAYKVVESTPEFGSFKSKLYDCGRDLAKSIGLSSRNGKSDMNPNYVRN